MRGSQTFKTIAQINTVGSRVLFIFLVVYGWSTNLVSVVSSQPEVEEVPRIVMGMILGVCGEPGPVRANVQHPPRMTPGIKRFGIPHRWNTDSPMG